MYLLPIVPMGYITQKTGNEKTQTHQVQFIALIEHQILVINLTRKCVAARGEN